MKRIIFILFSAIAILLPSRVSAQGIGEDGSFRPGWGIRVGVSINNPGRMNYEGLDDPLKVYTTGPGVTVGAFYTLPLGANFFFQPGAGFFYDTYKHVELTVSDDGASVTGTVNPVFRKAGLRIPAIFGFTVPAWRLASPFLYTGPQFNYAFAGSVKMADEYRYGEFSRLFGPDGHRRLDVSWKAGLGIAFTRWTATFEVDCGILDMKRGSGSFHENRFTLALAYNF